MRYHLVIGTGEVGTALLKVINQSKNDMALGIDIGAEIFNAFDCIHICFPYTNDFIEEVSKYYKKYGNKDNFLFIHSTVKPETTKQIAMLTNEWDYIGYTPVRGNHNTLEEDLLKYPKVLCMINDKNIVKVSEIFVDIFKHIEVFFGKTNELELAKLINTTFYMKELIFAQMIVNITGRFGFDKEVITNFIRSTDGRKILPYAQAIGGHCVVSNAKILCDYDRLPEYLIKYDKIFRYFYNDRKFDL